MDQAKLRELLSEFSNILRQVTTHPSIPILAQHGPNPSSEKATGDLKISTPSPPPETHTDAYSPDFDGWTAPQMKFRDLLVAFTKIPASNIQPSSQLAALGLDSISSIQLTSMVKRAGIKLSAADVARSITVADVAAIIARNSGLPRLSDEKSASPLSHPLLDDHVITKVRRTLPPSLQDAVELLAPVTPGMDFILSSWVRSGGWRFQHAFTFKLAPSVSPSRLHQAWNKLVERHAILRTIFTTLGNQNIICVLKPGSISTPWNEVIVDGSVGDLEEVGKIAKKTVDNPPRLRNGPAARVTYMRGKEGDYLILEMHHVLYDAWSFNMILRDLEDIYLGKALTERNDLRQLMNAIVSQENIQEQRTYWETALRDFEPSMVELSRTTQPNTQGFLSSMAIEKLARQAHAPLLFSLGVDWQLLAPVFLLYLWSSTISPRLIF
ncbi:Hydroxamate-type ferrichrome siderophore peptide synthetase [Rhizoctonia solani AG-1 IB]|uniref:Hydroxamate-type ferrichrome siderophore peptide synthetase n=1 Tax=Thanatephorus cucumeris (strain AG1-IB / isolate 7/3/14) TaxID=1108050 RepID=M5BQD7_THACB|nr:Hydroxamate-type ferrichrome siderophore peptide synthetase [Rhizoctonia solani AG-1 IB]